MHILLSVYSFFLLREEYCHVFGHGFCHLTLQPDKDWVILSERRLCRFHSQKSSFQDMSHQQVLFQVVTGAVVNCDIQLLLQCLPSRKCLGWGRGGHSTLLLIGWFGPVKRASFTAWNETLSTSDRDHKYSATALALSDIIAGTGKTFSPGIRVCLSNHLQSLKVLRNESCRGKQVSYTKICVTTSGKFQQNPLPAH